MFATLMPTALQLIDLMIINMLCIVKKYPMIHYVIFKSEEEKKKKKKKNQSKRFRSSEPTD